jgi:hypothetical protein
MPILPKTDLNTFRMLIYKSVVLFNCQQTCVNSGGCVNQIPTVRNTANVCALRRCTICAWSELKTNWRIALTVNLRVQKIVKALMQISKDSCFTIYMNSFKVFSLLKEKERFMRSKIFDTYLCVPLSIFGSKWLIFLKHRMNFILLESTPLT